MPSDPAVRRERYQSTKSLGTGTKPTSASTRKPRGRRKPTQNQIAKNLGTILELGNGTACELVPSYRQDALEQYEIELLSTAVAGEILANAQLLRWYQSFGTGLSGPHVVLAAAVVAIALPRLARRGLVPAKLAGMGMALAVGMGNSGIQGTDTVEPSGSAVPSDAGPARGGDWGHGEWEVVPGESAAEFEAAPPNRSN